MAVETPSSSLYQDASLATRLANEMMQRWRDGERPRAEEFLTQHAVLQNDPEAALRVIYEEVCLRQELGETVDAEEIYQRFPQWRGQLKMLLDCQRLLEAPATPELPASAESLGEFVLLGELGRGLQGRVYLATQPNLADRLVVLKTTPRTGQEHRTLARLQHTHIMPLYAVQDDPRRNLRTLCMPYFGGAALRQVLDELNDTPVRARTGQVLLDALDRAAARFVTWPPPVAHGSEPEQTPHQVAGPVRQMFARVSYVEAVCWIGACLADALQYAHERGLVHLDLKPSNVLLAADGQPMLLDFHIAQKPIQPGRPCLEGLGGTPAYLSPEQRAAMLAIQAGDPIRAAVDGRSDIYSLGLLLQEALGGKLNVDDNQADPSKRRYGPQVSVGLADIIGKCLQTEPRNRYATASALAADLRRHLCDQPLQGVGNRSLTERWAKWRRRQPYALAFLMMAIAVLTAALSVGLVFSRQAGQKRRDAEAALVDGQQHLKARNYSQAVADLTRGAALAENLSGDTGLAEKLNEQLHRARRALAAEQLHVLVDRLRFLYGASSLPAGEARTLARPCHALWDKRTWLKEQRGAELETSIELRLDTDLQDLGIIWADLCVRRASANGLAEAREEALRILADTEALFGASQILCRQRQIYAAAQGQTEVAETAGRHAAQQTPRTAWEHYSLGRFLLQTDELEHAARVLDRAVALQPQGFWPNFYQGVCAHRQKRFDEAATAFRVCIALAPDCAECYYNRGLAQSELGHNELALTDYDRALQLNPHLQSAALNRGLLHFGNKDYAAARADLERALAGGGDPAAVHYNLALIHLEQNDRRGAMDCLQHALQTKLDHVAARTLLDRLQRK